MEGTGAGSKDVEFPRLLKATMLQEAPLAFRAGHASLRSFQASHSPE